ncbi:MAG: ABC transporter ATP-binding protein [Candidatus Methanofastidiosia archaeon]
MIEVKLRNVTKTFGEIKAVDCVDIKIENGELFTLLGPSACGKTTILRLIAGFYIPDEGKIFFDEHDVTDLPPNERETGMVFQNYALWPHMNVFENIAYGLKVRKLPAEEIKKRVKDVLKLTHLAGFEKRQPHQLSGGQQQRIALARALVIRPKVLLLDEPLSNLDAKLRIEMRNEISRIQKRLGITTIYVTHDQEEALSISDRLAVMNLGKIQQIGSPLKIYSSPSNLFVADFIGECNLVEGEICGRNDFLEIETELGTKFFGVSLKNLNSKRVFCAIRPENIVLARPKEKYNSFSGNVVASQYFGKVNRLFVKVKNKTIIVDADPLKTIDLLRKTINLYVEAKETLVIGG